MKVAFVGKVGSISKRERLALASRGSAGNEEARKAAETIVEEVRLRGDAAVLEYCEKFDGAKMAAEDLLVKEEEFEEALENTPEEIVDALKKSAGNIRKFAELELEKSWFAELEGGRIGERAAKLPRGKGFVGKLVLPLERVGVYAPGGKAAYASSVLMGVVPAKAAGVKEVVVCSPPGKDGKCNSLVLVAAKIAGADKVFKIGGAQAVAALGLGTQSVPRVEKIVGPGNVFVNEAKKIVAAGGTAIDLPAGPSEVLIVADESCKPEWVAADLLAQAEHDENACAVLVATSGKVAEEVGKELEKQLAKLERREIAIKSLEKNGAILVAEDLQEAVGFANDYAPEHLELCVERPAEKLGLVNAGAVFLGNWSCEAVGDYAAGPNHVLPTGGTSRAWSGLSAKSFVKETSVEMFCEKDLEELAGATQTLAKAEGLAGHAKAVGKRMERRELE